MPVEIPHEKKSVPEGLWRKCEGCQTIVYNKDLEKNHMVCPKCNFYFRLNAYSRLGLLLDRNTFSEDDKNVYPADPLEFADSDKYTHRTKRNRAKTGLAEAVICGEGRIGKRRVMIGVLSFDYMGGSMGSVVGEKITRMIEKAVRNKLPVIIVSASGGARMQEGIFSLMQMAKTSAALAFLEKEKLPFISILTDPTSGGVTASFGMLGDINIAEPGAFIGFAGPIVIEQTIRQKLPSDFQHAEFSLKHGMIDMIVERKNLRSTVIKLLGFFK